LKTGRYRKYKALGFVEALIAIAVAGIASIVLMSIAINTISQVVRNEIENNLTEKAVEGASMAKKIAANNNESETGLFPQIDGNEGNCYAFTGDNNNPEFQMSGSDFQIACRYDAGEREQCLSYKTQDQSIFRVMCILPDSVPSSGLVVGKIVTGLADCDGTSDKGKCKINDYEYFLGVKVEQKN